MKQVGSLPLHLLLYTVTSKWEVKNIWLCWTVQDTICSVLSLWNTVFSKPMHLMGTPTSQRLYEAPFIDIYRMLWDAGLGSSTEVQKTKCNKNKRKGLAAKTYQRQIKRRVHQQNYYLGEKQLPVGSRGRTAAWNRDIKRNSLDTHKQALDTKARDKIKTVANRASRLQPGKTGDLSARGQGEAQLLSEMPSSDLRHSRVQLGICCPLFQPKDQLLFIITYEPHAFVWRDERTLASCQDRSFPVKYAHS